MVIYPYIRGGESVQALTAASIVQAESCLTTQLQEPSGAGAAADVHD